jgi:hypothetical protein
LFYFFEVYWCFGFDLIEEVFVGFTAAVFAVIAADVFNEAATKVAGFFTATLEAFWTGNGPLTDNVGVYYVERKEV